MKPISKYILVIFMIVAGTMHFVNPGFFLKIMPPYLPLDVCRSKSELWGNAMPFSSVEESLLVAAYYRGGSPNDHIWTSNSDQVVTLSLFYTRDISSEDCVERFSKRSYVSGLYEEDGELNELIETRYSVLIELIREFPELIEGGGNLKTPADPTYTACRLTVAGQKVACSLMPSFHQKPDFPNWPDRRTFPIVP